VIQKGQIVYLNSTKNSMQKQHSLKLALQGTENATQKLGLGDNTVASHILHNYNSLVTHSASAKAKASKDNSENRFVSVKEARKVLLRHSHNLVDSRMNSLAAVKYDRNVRRTAPAQNHNFLSSGVAHPNSQDLTNLIC